MKVKKLIKLLSELDPEADIVVHKGFNITGCTSDFEINKDFYTSSDKIRYKLEGE